MIKFIASIVFIGQMQVTSYQSLVKDTDSTPFHTSINEHVHPMGVAVSRDLLCGACRKLHKRCRRPDNPTKVHYHDVVYIEEIGFKVVNDVMGATKGKKRHPIKQQWDVWVPSLAAEKAFHAKFKQKKLKVWVVKEKQSGQ